MVSELAGPFAFGLSAFALIFAATQLLAISRLVAAEHAPVSAAIEYFLWQLPQIIVTVVPMAMLLGTLLALQRLSGESEITAMKAGGIGLIRAVAPLFVTSVIVSVAALAAQEQIVPYANDRATYVRDQVIRHTSPIREGNLTVTTSGPNGGRQVITAGGFEASTETMLDATVIQFDKENRPELFVFAERANYDPPSWTFENVREYTFHGTDVEYQTAPRQRLEIGVKPSQLIQRAANNSPENMSRKQVREVLASGSLDVSQTRAYEYAYAEKLARPFASVVFTLIALPFGMRPTRGGGAGLGFGLAVAILFVYFIVASVFSYVFTSLPGGPVVATIGAWTPNVLFALFGAALVRRTALA